MSLFLIGIIVDSMRQGKPSEEDIFILNHNPAPSFRTGRRKKTLKELLEKTKVATVCPYRLKLETNFPLIRDADLDRAKERKKERKKNR